MVCLDSHILLWWALDPERLSNAAERACLEMERSGGVVSAISLWELGLKIKQGKLDIGMTIERFHQKLMQATYLKIIPVDASLWIKNLELAWEHRDPADRTIVATALSHQAPLVTADEMIHQSGVVKVIW